MKINLLLVFGFLLQSTFAQNIGDFTSVASGVRTSEFIIPSTHSFQSIIEVGDALTEGGTLQRNPDFTGYVPIANSSVNGYLSINSEIYPGAVAILDINFNGTTKFWETTFSEAVDFSLVAGTAANCSGTVTPWGTIISSEELPISTDSNGDSYNDTGWNVEIDPVTKTVINNQKLWSMGNFSHENVAIHPNHRTVYQGADVIVSGQLGYLYKFVATHAQDLNDGLLYVYKGSKNGTGQWVLLPNTTIAERNDTYARSGADPDISDSDTNYANATVFNGVEDVEVGPDGWVYFAVKGAPDRRVYRFQDSDPLETTNSVVIMETFVGNTDANQNIEYNINDGTSTSAVAWGGGSDNLAFDDQGNLWVFQDGDEHYIWVVKQGHTQANPKVELFGRTPIGSEPTGITFSPDYKYLFMSIQHPDSENVANQQDAEGKILDFNKGTVLVISRNENFGTTLHTKSAILKDFKIIPNPIKSIKKIKVEGYQINNIKLYTILGKELLNQDYNDLNKIELDLKRLTSGLYIIKINNATSKKIIID
ncbi:DUF839 domain-containing protein [Algibacter amylolyticus]|uniref:DUF839 domain-containing protein n=1 Tax=Algibacter amylolyticus TaxID=1608400 RepID=A0A5M7BAW7_9FLAO|nr:alkaline phosphatase PhoX [Algibacter amylolyticus]KAA5825538.1 DUF839 domain-containing protein [Algibacter amylolyticus]MBB5268238.1 hypothetical protein [Algibacter amylolyticus]TSJ79836.1 DUF839 domain-containing protein [Algibacter amylolyticus]